jgi:hypothetical protein
MADNESIKLKGGASVKDISMSSPFATLSVNEGVLNVNLSVMANLYLSKKNIVTIKPFSDGVYRKGLIIEHNVAKYPKPIKFWNINNVSQSIDIINHLLIKDEDKVDEKRLDNIQTHGVGVFKPNIKRLLQVIFFVLGALKIYRFAHVAINNDFNINLYLSMFYNSVFIFVFLLSMFLCFSAKIKELIFYDYISKDINKGFLLCLSGFIFIMFIFFSLARI